MRKSQSSASFAKDDYDSDLALLDTASESEEVAQPSAANESQLLVEKILGRKFIPVEGDKMEEMYYIKWKGLSYLHASWERREDIEQVDLSAKQKLKRFLQTPQLPGVLGSPKQSGASQNSVDEGAEEEGVSSNVEDEEVEYFHPDMVEVQRIISCDTVNTSHSKARVPTDLIKGKSKKRKAGSNDSLADMDGDEENNVRYLVKWRGLPYDECTWERWEELKPWYRDVWLFWHLQKPVRSPKSVTVYPALHDYKKLDQSPSFGESTVIPPDDDMEPTGGLHLRDYQLEGVNWLLWNWWHKRPCILADEMGLGKTIQTVCFLHQLRYMATTNIAGPFLIIAPLSLVDQWQSEVATWSPDMNCVLLHGNLMARETIKNNEFYYNEPFVSRADAAALKKSGVCKFHVLLTTFEVAVKEVRALSNIPWEVMVIDEAHKLKNPSSRLFSTLSTIEAHHCLLLTGTPLQNKTEELWSLLNFADRKRFADLDDFVQKFGDLKDAKQVASLHDVLRPYLLRRIKEDVEKSLPPKEETIVEVALTSVQKRFYRAIFEKNTVYLFRGLKASNQPSLMNVMMELRKCCNHPYLVRGVEERILSEFLPEEEKSEVAIHQKMIESSGKLVLLDKLLPRLQSQGHKVLIFSQMVRVLNLLEDFLKFRGYSFERLDGTSKASDRKEAVERFCKPSLNRFIMLLSTKAGGLGLNLTAADTVIIYDSDWNPQNDLQAQARAHRIGQTKAVMVYRLLTRKTYEMQMFHQASLKLGLDRAVLAHARIEQEEEGHRRKKGESIIKADGKPNLGLKEIDELLKRGAYDVFREDDTEQNEFVEADIDSILQRRAHKVVYDSALSTTTSSLGNFSKASFVSADEREDVDINDPDFWRKAVGLKEDQRGLLHDAELVEEQLPSQRIRKQTKAWSGVTTVDEDQLKEFLKPIKPDKPDKKNLKAEKRELALKEKLEREEARKQKLQDEARMKSDPRNWGAHGRDRVLRCLNMYGFGRWERIKGETGKGLLDAKDLEAFSRAYVLQCGICASGQEPSKTDSMFVREAIRSAQEFQTLVTSGERTYDIPPSLADERFLAKLKTGQAKKILNKLDALAKLINLVRGGVEEAVRKRGLGVDVDGDIDTLVARVSVEEVCDGLQLGDVRPPWTRSVPWWTLECDRHLVLGVFKHGFGRYDLIREDDALMFKGVLARLAAEGGSGGGGSGGSGGGEGATPAPEGEGEAGEGAEEEEDDDDDEEEEDEAVRPVVLDSQEGRDVEAREDLLDFGDADKMEDHDMDLDDDGPGGSNGTLPGQGGKTDPAGTSTGGWPDPRHLNRLVIWLATSEAARMRKADLLESQKKERKGGRTAAAAAEAPPRREQPTIDLDARQLGTSQAMFIRGLLDRVDYDAVALVHKSQIQGLKKCEYILSLPLNYAELDAGQEGRGETASLAEPLEGAAGGGGGGGGARSLDGARPGSLDLASPSPLLDEGSGVPMDMSVDGEQSNPMDQWEGSGGGGGMSAAASDGLSPDKPTEISEFEAIRLSAALILFGAPVQDVHEDDGQTTETSAGGGAGEALFNWSRVQATSQVRLSVSQLQRFYTSVWLPFCEAISLKKTLSYSQHKYLVPNPLLSTSEHHVAARGLCHIFVIRQQLLAAAHYVMSHCYDSLQDYLRSAAGRNVDFMPSWWCPWIHDEGVLLSMIKHGFLSVPLMTADPSLPFHEAYLDKFIRRVFLQAPDPAPSFARFDVHSPQEAEAFVRASLWQFPESRDLELRMIRILEDLTRSLPAEHYCRVTVGQSYRGLVLQCAGGGGGGGTGGGGAGGEGDDKRVGEAKKADGKSNRSTARPPAVSLKMFLHTSRKRRRMYVSSYHPDCFGGGDHAASQS